MCNCWYKLTFLRVLNINSLCLNVRMAFQRCLKLEPRCVGALVGMSVLELNSKHVSIELS